MTFDLAGNPVEESIVPRQRARRAKAFDPNDIKTWHESDIQNMLKQRLALGGWMGIHVRKQGDRQEWGREHAGIIEAVPPRAAWGVLDWWCVPTRVKAGTRLDYQGVLWIELKSEKGKLTEDQGNHALILARAGMEVAVLRPRHFDSPPGVHDWAFRRLVNHERWGDWSQVLVQHEWDLAQVLKL